MSIKQDNCVPRTPLEVERRYKRVPGELEYIKELIELIEVDDTLSTSSVNPVQNKVITNALNTKVTKVAGKDLSTNDFTDEEKTKLNSIKANAEANILEKIYVAGVEQTITNKAVNLYVDSYMSDYSTNPIQNKVVKAYIDSKAGGSSGGGSSIHDSYISDNEGYIWYSDGLLIQWGRVSITPTAINTDTTARLTYTYSYDSIPDRKTEVSSATPTVAKVTSGGGTTVALSKQGMNIYVNSSTTKAVTVDWSAIGRRSV